MSRSRPTDRGHAGGKAGACPPNGRGRAPQPRSGSNLRRAASGARTMRAAVLEEFILCTGADEPLRRRLAARPRAGSCVRYWDTSCGSMPLFVDRSNVRHGAVVAGARTVSCATMDAVDVVCRDSQALDQSDDARVPWRAGSRDARCRSDREPLRFEFVIISTMARSGRDSANGGVQAARHRCSTSASAPGRRRTPNVACRIACARATLAVPLQFGENPLDQRLTEAGRTAKDLERIFVVRMTSRRYSRQT